MEKKRLRRGLWGYRWLSLGGITDSIVESEESELCKTHLIQWKLGTETEFGRGDLR